MALLHENPQAGVSLPAQSLPDKNGKRLNRTRFFRFITTLSYRQTELLCNVNFETSVAFVAAAGERENEKIVGNACYFLDPSSNLAEAQYTISPEWQGKGLGKALQNRLKDHAIASGVRGFSASILTENRRMILLARQAGEDVEVTHDRGITEVKIYFNARGSTPGSTTTYR